MTPVLTKAFLANAALVACLPSASGADAPAAPVHYAVQQRWDLVCLPTVNARFALSWRRDLPRV